MIIRMSVTLLFVVSLLMLAACGRSPSANLYTLELSHVVMDTVSAEPGDLSVGLRQVSLPSILNQPQIVLIEDAKVKALEFHRWSEPLDEAMLRVLSTGLRNRLNSSSVLSYPWPSTFKPQQTITIKVDRFSGLPGKNVELSGVWLIGKSGDIPSVRTERFHFIEKVDGDGYTALVQAHSAALRQLVEQLATELSKTN